MVTRAIKTEVIKASAKSIFEVLDESIQEFEEASVLAITSKIVALCEGRVAPSSANREEIIKAEADFYLVPELSRYGHHFTVIRNTLIAAAGIDESNVEGGHVLWPARPQKSAELIWSHLKDSFGLKKLGVIITDSTSRPLRLGTTGITIGYCGFSPVNSYVGNADLFGRTFKVNKADVAGGLASSAVVAMGEGAEQTPIAIISDVPFVKFQSRKPRKEELEAYSLSLQNDLFAPFLKNANWQKGQFKI